MSNEARPYAGYREVIMLVRDSLGEFGDPRLRFSNGLDSSLSYRPVIIMASSRTGCYVVVPRMLTAPGSWRTAFPGGVYVWAGAGLPPELAGNRRASQRRANWRRASSMLMLSATSAASTNNDTVPTQ